MPTLEAEKELERYAAFWDAYAEACRVKTIVALEQYAAQWDAYAEGIKSRHEGGTDANAI